MNSNHQKSSKGIKYAKKILSRVQKIPMNKRYKLEEYASMVYEYRNNRVKSFNKKEARSFLYGLYKANKSIFSNKNKKGIVYLIGNKKQKVCKIGFTNNSVEDRLKNIQTGCPYELEIIKTWNGLTRKDEKLLHETYKNYRLNGEWFKLNSRIKKELIYS